MFYKNIEANKKVFFEQYHTDWALHWFVKSFVIILHFLVVYWICSFLICIFFLYPYDVHILNGGEPDIPSVLQRAYITPTNRRTAEDLEYQDSPLPGWIIPYYQEVCLVHQWVLGGLGGMLLADFMVSYTLHAWSQISHNTLKLDHQPLLEW